MIDRLRVEGIAVVNLPTRSWGSSMRKRETRLARPVVSCHVIV